MGTGVGGRIRAARLDKGWTQEELARRMGKTKSLISKVENGLDNLTSDKISEYAEALDTSPAKLMGWEETPEFRRRHTFKSETDETGHIRYITVPNPSATAEKLKALEKAYMDTMKAAETLRKYGDLLNNPQIQKLLDLAAECEPDQIDLAISVLSLKKG